jgi:hypothetical protein
MELQLPPGTHTYQSDSHHTWTTIDLFFCNSDPTHRVLTCSAVHGDRIPTADHLPIHTTLNLDVNKCPAAPGRDFRNVDWTAFKNQLNNEITHHGPHINAPPSTPDQINEYVLKLTTAIQTCINSLVRRLCVTPYSKHWWTPKLTTLRHEYALRSRDEYHSHFTANWANSK